MSQSFTPADVASHNSADNGMYIIVDNNVYDVTKFVDEHPGGAKILKRVAGKDASKQFWKVLSLSPCLFSLFCLLRSPLTIPSTTTKACSRSTRRSSRSAKSRKPPNCKPSRTESIPFFP